MEVTWPIVLATLAGAAVPTVFALVAHRRLRARQADADTRLARARVIGDALNIGLLVLDADDRVLAWNADFEQLYPPLDRPLEVGERYEDLLRRRVRLGQVPEAAGREDAWVAERMALHRQPRGPMLRRMADGRWRRITERYLADGCMIS
jgi:PAS domain-containing protein